MGDNFDARRTSPVKTRRSRRGCLTCRQRKVKCDETRDVCRNCFRLDARCTWETPGDSEPGRRRSRNWRACARCRDKKLRCTAPSSGPGCGQCLKAGATCDALSSVGGEAKPALSIPASEDTKASDNVTNTVDDAASADSIVPREELLQILDAYFAGPHYFCYSTFLHRPSFMKMLDNGLIPRSLLLIVLATGLQVMGAVGGSRERSRRADAWADECRGLVVLDVFARISTTNLQTLLLLQRYEWHRGGHLSAWFLSGVAYRLAHALQLHLEPTDVCEGKGNTVRLPPSVVETRRRLIWSCYVMDTVPDVHQSGTRPLQSLLDPAVIHSRLPCDEVQYERGEADRERGRERHARPSIGAYLISMVMLRQRILKYSWAMRAAAVALEECREEAAHDAAKGTTRVWPWHDGSAFYALKQQLDGLAADLPAAYQLRSHASVPRHDRTAFYTFHTMFHAVYTDLLRIGTFVGRHMPAASPSRRGARRGSVVPPPAFVHACKVEQLKHACGIAHVVAQCLRQQGLASEHDPFMAICSCLAMRILVMERWREGRDGRAAEDAKEVLSLDDARVKDGMAACLECAKRTARWSMPIRKLLLAVGDMALQYGHLLDLDEFRPPTQRQMPLTPPPMSRGPPPTRPMSPNLKLYGTSGLLERARDAHDREVVQSVEVVEGRFGGGSAEPEITVATTGAPTAVPTTLARPVPIAVPRPAHSDDSARSSLSLSAEALQIASNWADGTYDVPMAQTNFDWGSFEFGMNFVPMGGGGGVGSGGLQGSFPGSLSGSLPGSFTGSMSGQELPDVLNVGVGAGIGADGELGVPGVEFGIADGEGLDLHFGFY
ncbi:uncharacterized protein SPSK_10514 [Sporothrix schenckii 1099-18]|uniref:Zn(2)-C6 fungal-type domain-containing protein n=1 Tax=Sporothrix schenckii 1099-18 TaxID=1397361 RepID=A0A0F2LX21_SPOSC|nr:uncharacterized protein SPSK_10514 [Sporothrix schenckii 1099-18]KJR82002.1 hypothetical protein SPSK_10514 [Sporothrix schenckii 1099-18]